MNSHLQGMNGIVSFGALRHLYPICKRSRKASLAVLLMGWLVIASTAQAELRFANIFGDNIVLQQEKDVRVWGWAHPGAEVAVAITEEPKLAEPVLEAQKAEKEHAKDDEYKVTMTYAEENVEPFKTQSRSVKAGADGRWLASFDPMKASFQPRFIIARSGEEAIALKNVLIGEVWVCSGQSNMAWRNFDSKDLVIPGAMRPGIRHARFHQTWYKPLDDLRNKARWSVCSPETAGEFSAVPLIFSIRLHDYLKVPVGIINNARGGTLGLTWTTRAALESIHNKIIKEILKGYDAETTKWESKAGRKKIMAEWQAKCEEVKSRWEKDAAKAKAGGKKAPRLRLPRKPSDPRSGWSPPGGMFNAVVHPIGKMAIRGVLY